MATFSCFFVLFQVMSWLFSIPLRTVNNTKTQGDVSVCTEIVSTVHEICVNAFKPNSHQRHKHKHKINTKTKHVFSSGTCEDKTTRIFLCFPFCSALGLCLDYDLMLMFMLMTILISQAWLHFFVLPFVLPLCLCYRVNEAISVTSYTMREIILLHFIGRVRVWSYEYK